MCSKQDREVSKLTACDFRRCICFLNYSGHSFLYRRCKPCHLFTVALDYQLNSPVLQITDVTINVIRSCLHLCSMSKSDALNPSCKYHSVPNHVASLFRISIRLFLQRLTADNSICVIVTHKIVELTKGRSSTKKNLPRQCFFMVYTNHNDIDAWLRPAVLFATCNYLAKLSAFPALFTCATAPPVLSSNGLALTALHGTSQSLRWWHFAR
jgi:hypothetical protein